MGLRTVNCALCTSAAFHRENARKAAELGDAEVAATYLRLAQIQEDGHAHLPAEPQRHCCH